MLATQVRGGPARTTVQTLGLLVALTGVEHGVGEMSQGPGAPPGVVFESWPRVAAFEPLDGEPAMTVLPDLLVSGAASVVVALLIGACAVRCTHRHTGPALVGLSLVLLLVGGGFGPPLLGLLTGLFASRRDVSPQDRPSPVARFAARLWPSSLVVAVACFLGLFPGTPLLQAAGGVDSAALVTALGLGAFAGTALAMWSARVRTRVGSGARPSHSSYIPIPEDHHRKKELR